MDELNESNFKVRFWRNENDDWEPLAGYRMGLAVLDKGTDVEALLKAEASDGKDPWWRYQTVQKCDIPAANGAFFSKLVRWLEALILGVDRCGFRWKTSSTEASTFWYRSGFSFCLSHDARHRPEDDAYHDPEKSSLDIFLSRASDSREETIRTLYSAFRQFVDSDGYQGSTPPMEPLIDAVWRSAGWTNEESLAERLSKTCRRNAARGLQMLLHAEPSDPKHNDGFRHEARASRMFDEPNFAVWDRDLALLERDVFTEAWDQWGKDQREKHLLEVAFHLGPQHYNSEFEDPAAIRSPMIEAWLADPTPLPLASGSIATTNRFNS